MGLAAAEVRLEIDDRGASASRDALDGLDQEASQAIGEVGPAEELRRVDVLRPPLALAHLVEVGGELSQGEAACCHILVWLHDVAPRTKAGAAVSAATSTSDFGVARRASAS